MDRGIVRINKINIKNLKNVGNGDITFSEKICENFYDQKSDILGIYGQNGSGKTTVIYALYTLKNLLIGNRLDNDFENYIKANKEKSTAKFELEIMNVQKQKFKCIYEFEIKKAVQEDKNTDFFSLPEQIDFESSIYISMERLCISRLKEKGWTRMTPVLEYFEEEEKPVVPNKNYHKLTNGKKEIEDEVRFEKLFSKRMSKSFIFSPKMQNIIFKSSLDEEVKEIFKMINMYATYKLHVISNIETGAINANIGFPIAFVSSHKDSMTMLKGRLNLNGTSQIPEEHYKIIAKNIETSNTVLKEIIPHLSISLQKTGTNLDENNEKIIVAELIANRGDVKIPLKYESDGIKKLVSILYMLIMVYNDPSMTLAVDEFDSGIFEHLLGEILSIIEKFGKGQLIFTSHNLRPLEVINKNNILFTTTNEENRYIKFKNLKANHNFRNMYFHDIILGGQSEVMYEITSPHRIRHAFSIAGDNNG
ncbi:AAA family ATPase [Tannockella kyphosi]|uniref:AAA family ATPase n=1 Tax=Tannockella kyphosi TaxID=2899121 RepID=UPI002012BC92|nr:AAA family ATPase [Tannockella kyphosi]